MAIRLDMLRLRGILCNCPHGGYAQQMNEIIDRVLERTQ